jgi:DNA-binding transcriptional regulator YdaS (Cro superfamily)
MELRDILNRAGSRASLARALGVSPQAAHGWVDFNRIPAARAIQIEQVTDGLIKRHELRPDLWEPPVEEASVGN